MKKVLIIILSLALMLTFTACGEKNGGKSPSESSAPAESGNAPSGEAGADENKYYGIGEAVDVDDGFEITIDKVEIIDDLSIFQQYSEGYVYIKVYATAKNITDEKHNTKDSLLRIVRDDNPDPELSDYSRNRNVWNTETEEMYIKEYIAPGETNGGFMVFQLKPDEKEIIMTYDVIYPTDIRFKIQIP